MLLTSCGTTSQKPQINTIEVTKEVKEKILCLDAPELENIRWEKVILVEAKSLDGVNIIGINESQYRNLAKNWQNAKKSIIDRNSIIQYYIECIYDFNNSENEK